jgi:hypothetical protein
LRLIGDIFTSSANADWSPGATLIGVLNEKVVLAPGGEIVTGASGFPLIFCDAG